MADVFDIQYNNIFVLFENTHKSNVNMIINTVETKISRKLVAIAQIVRKYNNHHLSIYFLRNCLNLHNNVTVT